jgi:site-specific recombinase XerD
MLLSAMLRYQRNHIAGCKSGNSCRKCPYWIEGRHLGKRWHHSLKTTDAKTAAQLVQRVILNGRLELEPEDLGITIADAITQFFAEQESRGAAVSSIKSFRKFLNGAPNRRKCKDPSKFSPTLLEFAANEGIEYLLECSTDFVAGFRQAWRVNKYTNQKQTERMKSFFEFAVSRKWITENPAAPLQPPVGTDNDVPVIPFTKQQFAAIIKSCASNEYLKTFILVMRYSGLATVDAVSLTPDRLEGNHLKLRRTKTKGWVKVLLPPQIANRLRSLPLQQCGFWFWNKQLGSRHETATGNMRRMLRPIFGPEGANIVLRDEEGNPILDRHGKQRYGHPYQLRHTFVRDQLEKGATLERIAELLGNTYKIVEKHYSAWVQSRQTILDETVKRSWDEIELASY